eukprot:1159641-Pelagomonas_calceolata.AAC.16
MRGQMLMRILPKCKGPHLVLSKVGDVLRGQRLAVQEWADLSHAAAIGFDQRWHGRIDGGGLAVARLQGQQQEEWEGHGGLDETKSMIK